jgi:CheY-like chemotaxis protein
LITDLLDVSKIDAGAIELSFGSVPIDAIFEAAGAMVRDNIVAKNLNLVVPTDLKFKIMGDQRRCLQILLNLLTNAIKYTPEKGIIEVKATRHENSFVKISVKDSGVGIDAENQVNIFKEFHQVDPKRDSALGGSGIGLALTSRLVELHGGKLGVESRKGEGSEFWFTLPMFDVAAKSKESHDEAKTQASDLSGCRKVLVFEDSEVNIALIQGFFGNHHDVKIAENGELGIDIARSFMPEIILMDTRMPIMDGIEATRYLKSDDSLKHIPVIGLSASADPESLRQCYEAGVNDHITKPIQFDELISTMTRLLQ